MAKHWCSTYFVAVGLLSCLVERNVEAQISGMWMKPTAKKAVPSPQMPSVLQPQRTPQHHYGSQVYSAQQQGHSQSPQSTNRQAERQQGHSQNPQSTNRQAERQQGHSQNPQSTNRQAERQQGHSQYPQSTNRQAERQLSHDQSPQEPTFPQGQQQKDLTIPWTKTQPTVKNCEVAESIRVPCGPEGISADYCEHIGCCLDGRQCYYGKAVTVQCTKDAQFIVVVARDATLPGIDLESVSLLGKGDGCTHVDSNSGFAIYNFPVTKCGTTVTEEAGVIIYDNSMSSSYEILFGDKGIITRDTLLHIRFQCRYVGTSVETLVVDVRDIDNPPLSVAALGPVNVQLRLANGQCQSKGCNEVDVAYTSFYTEADYPVTKVLREPVYVEVRLLEKSDPNLVLTLGHCWTTTTATPHSLPQWDLLINGCPYKEDLYLSSLVPVGAYSGLDFPSHYKRFIFKMFSFVDSNSMTPTKAQVYIHCSTSVCTATQGNTCEPRCFRRRRDVQAAEQINAEPKTVVSVGPLIIIASEEQQNAETQDLF